MNMVSSRMLRRRRAGAFTLIELLLVLVILAILAGIVVPKFIGRSEQAKAAAAKSDISNLKTALGTFEIDNSRFPSTEEGLQALVDKPAGDLPNWKHMLDKVPTDPWGHPYVYRCPGTGNKEYDLISVGPDGQEGTKDDVE
jgi:general secretion pathway protein G